MAAPLKDSFGPEVPRRIADEIGSVAPGFPREDFLARALAGYADLELTPRARHIAAALAQTLPEDPAEGMAVLVASLGPPLDERPAEGMESFVYLPHVFYVAENGLGAYEEAMAAQHAITQRFTCEFSIRAFIDAEPTRTLAILEDWTADPSPHVRRLVSEGTRPRLPWAPRLRRFQEDPAPVVALLERLRDDPSEYVRRSVANNLNDISKDHAEVTLEVAGRWMADAPPERRRLVRHALRTLLKAGDPAALAILGHGDAAGVVVRDLQVAPSPAGIGGAVDVTAEVANAGTETVSLRIDLRIDFVKARGTTSPKVFTMREAEIAPGGSTPVRKRVSLRQHSTRTHFPGTHRATVVVNGADTASAAFEVLPA